MNTTADLSRTVKAFADGKISREVAHKRAGQLLQVLPRTSSTKSRCLKLWRETLR